MLVSASGCLNLFPYFLQDPKPFTGPSPPAWDQEQIPAPELLARSIDNQSNAVGSFGLEYAPVPYLPMPAAPAVLGPVSVTAVQPKTRRVLLFYGDSFLPVFFGDIFGDNPVPHLSFILEDEVVVSV